MHFQCAVIKLTIAISQCARARARLLVCVASCVRAYKFPTVVAVFPLFYLRASAVARRARVRMLRCKQYICVCARICTTSPPPPSIMIQTLMRNICKYTCGGRHHCVCVLPLSFWQTSTRACATPLFPQLIYKSYMCA